MDAFRTITRIEAQKKRKNRVSIYLDDEFAFGLDIAVLAKFNLSKGDCLDEERISDILFAEEQRQVRESAIRYLAGRAHSEKELRIKLARKGYAESVINDVLAQLKADKFLDDEEFALSYVRSRMVSKPMGERLLRQELWQKGVSESTIDRAVQAAYADNSQRELALQLAQKRWSRDKHLPEQERKRRLHDFLMRRGFEWDIVSEVIHLHDH